MEPQADTVTPSLARSQSAEHAQPLTAVGTEPGPWEGNLSHHQGQPVTADTYLQEQLQREDWGAFTSWWTCPYTQLGSLLSWHTTVTSLSRTVSPFFAHYIASRLFSFCGYYLSQPYKTPTPAHKVHMEFCFVFFLHINVLDKCNIQAQLGNRGRHSNWP